MENNQDAWLEFNKQTNKITKQFGSTGNIIGDYAEYLAHQYYGGTRLKASNKSADIEGPDGKKYQIKARKVHSGHTTQLGIIRSWDFDYLTAVLFDSFGNIKRAIEMPVDVARFFATPNKHQNGSIITITKNVLNDPRCKDITRIISEMAGSAELSANEHPKISVKPNLSLSIPTMKKSEALKIARIESSTGIHFSNRNKATSNWWLDIPTHEIDSDKLDSLTFLLNDPPASFLHIIQIPTHFLRANTGKIKLFPKKTGNFYSLHIAAESSRKFQNIVPAHSNIDFSRFLKESIPV